MSQIRHIAGNCNIVGTNGCRWNLTRNLQCSFTKSAIPSLFKVVILDQINAMFVVSGALIHLTSNLFGQEAARQHFAEVQESSIVFVLETIQSKKGYCS